MSVQYRAKKTESKNKTPTHHCSVLPCRAAEDYYNEWIMSNVG